jgi:hypothetical protein
LEREDDHDDSELEERDLRHFALKSPDRNKKRKFIAIGLILALIVVILIVIFAQNRASSAPSEQPHRPADGGGALRKFSLDDLLSSEFQAKSVKLSWHATTQDFAIYRNGSYYLQSWNETRQILVDKTVVDKSVVVVVSHCSISQSIFSFDMKYAIIPCESK